MPGSKQDPRTLPVSGVYGKLSLSYEAVMEAVLELAEDRQGAVATYIGRTKSPGFSGRPVRELLIETERGYTDDALRRVCEEVRAKYGLQLALIYHFEGAFIAGEMLVMVVVVGKARPETFAALQELLARFKPEGHIRKKEVYDDGESEWIAN